MCRLLTRCIPALTCACLPTLIPRPDPRLAPQVSASYSTELDFTRTRVGEWVIEGVDAPSYGAAPAQFGTSGSLPLPPPMPPSGGLTGAPIVMHF